MLFGHALEIGRVIVGGEGVFLSAEFGHDFRLTPGLWLFVPLNIGVFEEMRDADLPSGSSAEPLRYHAS